MAITAARFREIKMATNSLERQSRNQRLSEMPRKKAHGEHGKNLCSISWNSCSSWPFLSRRTLPENKKARNCYHGKIFSVFSVRFLPWLASRLFVSHFGIAV